MSDRVPVRPVTGSPLPPSTGAFRAVAAVFAVVMAGTTIPTPLYGLYQENLSLDPFTVTVLFAVYAFGVLGALIGFGRLSDEVGRRPVLLAAGLLAVASSGTFLFAHGLGLLLVGRVLSGLAAGLVSGTATAALVDFGGAAHRARSATIGVAANMGGLALGTLGAGILADVAPQPLRTPFLLHLACAVITFLLVAALVPGVLRRRWRIRPQRPAVPAAVRPLFVRAVLAGGSGFAVTGLLTAVSAVFLARDLGSSSHTLAGGVVAAAFATMAVGQLGARRLMVSRALPAACAGLIVAALLVGAALVSRTLAPLLLGAVVLGVSTGIAIGSGLAGILAATPAQRRGETSSAFFAGLYAMLSVPVLGVGALARLTDVRTAGTLLSGAVAVLCGGVLLSLIARRR